MFPRLFVVPELDAGENATPAGKVDGVASSGRRNAVCHAELLGATVIEVEHEAIEENGVATDAQLNGAKHEITTSDLDPPMVLARVDPRATEEVPRLPSGKQRAAQKEGPKQNDRAEE